MLYLVSNINLENILGDVPIIGYINKINELLVSTVHMVNVFRNSDPVMGGIEEPQEASRIATFGISDIEGNEEKSFFSLDRTKEKCYIYSINEERLKTEGDLRKKINRCMENNGTSWVRRLNGKRKVSKKRPRW